MAEEIDNDHPDSAVRHFDCERNDCMCAGMQQSELVPSFLYAKFNVFDVHVYTVLYENIFEIENQLNVESQVSAVEMNLMSVARVYVSGCGIFVPTFSDPIELKQGLYPDWLPVNINSSLDNNFLSSNKKCGSSFKLISCCNYS